MSNRATRITGWTCAILAAAYSLFAAVMKFVPMPPDSDGAKIMQQLGLTTDAAHALGVVEIIIILLFLIPRTSTVGFVLMIGYMGGAFATNLTHGFTDPGTDISFVIFFALMTLSAWGRNPELLDRLAMKPVSVSR
ncbi:MAG TPA: DoxX family protein [Candidatus Peribacteraceae bacterium]|nr:DoxX family protein [Candidatus Peribacteraceae bacterium]